MLVEADLVRTDRQTHTQTHRPTTVTLASACTRRGLITKVNEPQERAYQRLRNGQYELRDETEALFQITGELSERLLGVGGEELVER